MDVVSILVLFKDYFCYLQNELCGLCDVTWHVLAQGYDLQKAVQKVRDCFAMLSSEVSSRQETEEGGRSA